MRFHTRSQDAQGGFGGQPCRKQQIHQTGPIRRAAIAINRPNRRKWEQEMFLIKLNIYTAFFQTSTQRRFGLGSQEYEL